mgnify:FL=1
MTHVLKELGNVTLPLPILLHVIAFPFMTFEDSKDERSIILRRWEEKSLSKNPTRDGIGRYSNIQASLFPVGEMDFNLPNYPSITAVSRNFHPSYLPIRRSICN